MILALPGCTEPGNPEMVAAIATPAVDTISEQGAFGDIVIRSTSGGPTSGTVVIGGGPAGLAAAMDIDGPVTLIEAEDVLGGRARFAGLLLFVGTEEQDALGVANDVDALLADWETLTGEPATAATVAWLAASDAVHDRLVDLGLHFQIGRDDPILRRWWLHLPDGGGTALVEALAAALPSTVDVRLGTRVRSLVLDGNRVTGVQIGPSFLRADRVVIATGGFVNRADLVGAVIADEPGSWGIGKDPYAQGDALDWADRFGLGTDRLDAIGFHADVVGVPGSDGRPIEIVHTQVIPWVWVDRTGLRFVDESATWSILLAGKERARGEVWALGTWEGWFEKVAPEDQALFLAAREEGGAIRCAESWEAVAEAVGADVTGVLTTMAEVEAFASGASADPLGRSAASFSVDVGTPCAYRPGHLASKGFGGLAVTEAGQVLDADGVEVHGLYAVGEAAGMGVPGMGGASGWDGSLSAVVWSGWRTAAALNAE